ncbi:MAG: chloride channel protein [Ottowia sp.]
MDGWRWLDRAVVLAYGALAGAVVVGFTLLSQRAFHAFEALYHWQPWIVLVWTPLLTAALAWITIKAFPRAAGSGIPQVIAALDTSLDAAQRSSLVSLRLSIAKVLLASAGLLAGLSVGREGPSVQVAAGVMQHAQRWFRQRGAITISPHALLVAGGAAGIAAAFNAPLAGVVFAIEELSRRMEARYSGVILASIVLAGLIGVSVFGNTAYFGTLRVPPLNWGLLLPGIGVALAAGLAGGLFARLMTVSLLGTHNDRFAAWRRQYPVRFAAGCGFAVAVIGLVSGGMTFGGGTEAASALLHGEAPPASELFAPLKFITLWLTAWSGVPAGIFAPSLSIGAGIGYDMAQLTGHPNAIALIAMGMAGFLAAVTQAPLTSFIIVMEMIDGRSMVLSLMAVAMASAGVSRMISRPLYATLAAFMVAQVKAAQAAAAAKAQSAEEAPAASSAAAATAPAAPTPAAATPTPAPPSPQTPSPPPLS